MSSDPTPAPCSHRHRFHSGSEAAESSTRRVLWITAAAMLVEISAGWWFNSMALLADGWHMSSHALAIGLTAFAYATSRRYASDARFAFGTWKVEVLAGFTSAILLLAVAALMVVGSLERLVAPQAIHYREALLVAAVGLAVNLACALILARTDEHHHHGHGHGHGHDDGHGHAHEAGHHQGDSHAHAHAHARHDTHGRQTHRHAPGSGDHPRHRPGRAAPHQDDLNLRSAYLHVLADAATSVLAILALVGGWLLGWDWLDALMGLVGAVLVAAWARGLATQTAKVLLDREMDDAIVSRIRDAVQTGGDRVTDLHVWRVGRTAYACVLTLLTRDGAVDAQQVRDRLGPHPEIVHSTIEIQRASGPA
ncbi:MAG TPA: CDF family Co(II)/Ni(II) efflux transporter DmeF [Ramlibacter sp.]|jgi:cation diffusion facilitator family transporter|uniref:CDF family Co(II)/Ni(II) efflux transporter DmeF n=1 Tax=Ramlibacter sp. TaxID=1917967 RepID=UPI002D47C7CB|nr:CDF family Co(II)/Ni(II) efflux transporter DmeF [Ramlibacter sp.]HZY20169.1 CDF family Co(II)/Ni(II) efflux transporter DmeF [Ramlibacter sp.]